MLGKSYPFDEINTIKRVQVGKKNRKKDPYAAREAGKYDNPIPSREYISQILEDSGKPQNFNYLISAFGLQSDIERQEAMKFRLRAMVRDGQLMRDRKGRFALLSKMDLICGQVIGHKDGFGWVEPENAGPRERDIFLNPKEMRKVFHGDRVLVRAEKRRKREGKLEGVIVEILEHGITHVVGKYFIENGLSFVEPDNRHMSRDISVPPSEAKNAKSGDYVVVEITKYPNKRHQPIGKITEVLGSQLEAGMEVELALRSYEIPFEWSKAVLSEIDDFTPEVPEKDKKGRLDLRNYPFVTIDGEDARDYDDAVYCEPRKDGGWVVYVAIADVSHYLKPNTALEAEAKLRGNSVYFPSRVIPMLPEILSNELCSLKPKVDRLAMVCKIDVNEKGEMQDHTFHEGVIHSHARLTYNLVADILEGNSKEYSHLHNMLFDLHKLYNSLFSARKKRGAIDFETKESQIIFDEKGKIDTIVARGRNVAHRIIEECMLLANVAGAAFLQKNKIATLFRVHERPDPEKLEKLRDFLSSFGLKLGGYDTPSAKHYGKLLSQIEGRTDKQLIQTVMLRSLQQAIYSPENVGHFGLAYPEYLHFTSPIRRYPDVIVHRAIRHLINDGNAKNWSYSHEELVKLGLHSSQTERRADEATREAMDWLKCEYMQDKLGEVYDAIITSAVSFGIFAELKDVYVEGLVHVTGLPDDYYEFDDIGHRLIGQRTGRVYRLGDEIKVQVVRVDIDERKIDFEIIEDKNAGTSKKGRKTRSR